MRYYASSFVQDLHPSQSNLKFYQQLSNEQTLPQKYSSLNYIYNYPKYSNASNTKAIQSRISSSTNLTTIQLPNSKKSSSESYFESNGSYKTTKHPYNRQRRATIDNTMSNNNLDKFYALIETDDNLLKKLHLHNNNTTESNKFYGPNSSFEALPMNKQNNSKEV